jgi:hypothetical protein
MSFLFVALLVGFDLSARCQVVGIFEQGAEELKEYGQQIAALELLLSGQRKGYQIIESGLSSIGSITGSEFNLHQNYYAGLGAVNPAIIQVPEVSEFLILESSMLANLSTALNRCRKSNFLTSTDIAFIIRMSAIFTNTVSSQIASFNRVLFADSLTLTDDQRITIIDQLDREARSSYTLLQSLIATANLLILNRER